METNQLIISSSPHIRSNEDVSQIMKDVLIALLPATLASIYFFRVGAIINIVVGIIGAVGAEYLCQKERERKEICSWEPVPKFILGQNERKR